jgi:hypothetical protein
METTMTKLSDAQYGVLSQLEQHGAISAIEVAGPPKMDGTRKAKLECHACSIATLNKLSDAGLVHVERGEPRRPVNAVGKKGHARTELLISITEKGRQAIS